MLAAAEWDCSGRGKRYFGWIFCQHQRVFVPWWLSSEIPEEILWLLQRNRLQTGVPGRSHGSEISNICIQGINMTICLITDTFFMKVPALEIKMA